MKRLLCGLVLCTFSARAAETTVAQVEPWWNLRVKLLSNDERVVLRRVEPPLKNGGFLCKAPCNAVVRFQLTDEFELAGKGVVASDSFHLPPRGGELTLRVTASDSGPRFGGILLMVLGGGTATLGGILATSGPAYSSLTCDGDSDCLARHASQATTARAVALVGLVAAGLGLLLLLTSRPTRFTAEGD